LVSGVALALGLVGVGAGLAGAQFSNPRSQFGPVGARNVVFV
jgi:hypothetical protein